MPNIKRFASLIPARSRDQTQNIGGKAFGAIPPPDAFPSGNDGQVGPFAPVDQPTEAVFGDWLDYYVNLIGASVESMNALQFNMTQENSDDQAAAIGDELAKLADALGAGSAVIPTNPKELRWPLAGSYTFNEDPDVTGFKSFIIDLFFENEPDYRLVVNFTMVVTATDKDGTIGASSSSSYVAPSSH